MAYSFPGSVSPFYGYQNSLQYPVIGSQFYAPPSVYPGATYYVAPAQPLTYAPPPPTFTAPVQRKYEYDDFFEKYAFRSHPLEQAFRAIPAGKKAAPKSKPAAKK